MKQNDSFRWVKRTGEALDTDVWSSFEMRWIPGAGIFHVISVDGGVLSYRNDGGGLYAVSLKEAMIQGKDLHYPVDYVYPSIIK
jgi:hypothetical protein